jgi:hypothetical protein
MGLTLQSAKFLLGEKKKGLEFNNILTLGHQGVYMNQREYNKLLRSLGSEKPSATKYADDFFKGIGVEQIDIMDASDYEGATMLQDLNQPLPEGYDKLWDCVIDGGTLEHVFNFPQAIKTCMELVKEGGHLILITPWHNYAGHGFYEFSPELFFRILSPENGYCVERMLINQKEKWFSIIDPKLIHSRVEIKGDESTLLYISAKRVEIKEIFSQWPQQSDYSSAWLSSENLLPNQQSNISGFKVRLFEIFPVLYSAQDIWRNAKSSFNYEKTKSKWCIPLEDDCGVPL